MTHANKPLTAVEAAAEIRSPINTSPHSPHQHELEAVIARVTASECTGRHAAAKRAEYLAFLADLKEVCDRKDLPDDDPDFLRTTGAIEAFENEVWEVPAQGWEEILHRAEIARYNENGIMKALHEGYRCQALIWRSLSTLS
jgi:hypothetical protein